MPPRKFVRRRDIIVDESSQVSSFEQARLLNDPDVCFETTPGHRSRRTTDDNTSQLRQPTELNRVADLLNEVEKAA